MNPRTAPIADPHATIRKTGSRGRLTENLLAPVSKAHQEMVAAAFRSIFALTTPTDVAARWDEVALMLAERFPKAAALMDDAKTDVLAFTAFPKAHWRQIWSNNPLERLNKEIRRRTAVVGIFPTTPQRSASSALCCPTSTTSGSSPGATSPRRR